MADFMTNSLTNHTLEFIKNGITTTDTKGLVAQAIREVGISNGYGFRVFKQIYGVSPREYLSKIKINEAKKLLMKPQYTVTDISDALGYKNLTNFSRQFKRWTGLSPKQWKVQTFKTN
jgi:AraC-like DNA-binding protein